MKERIKDINPECHVVERRCFFLPENQDGFNFKDYNYVVDAVDTVAAKIAIVLAADRAGVPVISSMGTGNKFDPLRFKTADIYETSVCPLARVMRRELKKRGIKKLKTVFSDEQPKEYYYVSCNEEVSDISSKRSIPGSLAYVPPVAGLIIASVVISELIKL